MVQVNRWYKWVDGAFQHNGIVKIKEYRQEYPFRRCKNSLQNHFKLYITFFDFFKLHHYYELSYP